MAKTNIPGQEEIVNGDYGRKPYMVGKDDGDLDYLEYLRGADGGGTYRALMGRNTQTLMDRSIGQYLQHSEFKKPYRGDEFVEMEHFIDLTTYEPIIPPSTGFYYPEVPSPQDPYVIVGGYGDPNPGEGGEFGGGSGGGAGSSPPGWSSTPAGSGGDSGESGSCIDYCTIENNYLGYSWNSRCTQVDFFFQLGSAQSDESTAVYVQESNVPIGSSLDSSFVNRGRRSDIVFTANVDGGKTVRVVFRQPLWSICPFITSPDQEYDPCILEVSASCDPICDLSWDPNSDTTVTQSGGAAVAIIDTTGSGPYYWYAAGFGFSMAAEQTSGLTNTLIASATACGSATITVIALGGSCPNASGYVRCVSSGSWSFLGSGVGFEGYATGDAEGRTESKIPGNPDKYTFEGVYGRYKVFEAVSGQTSGSTGCGSYPPPSGLSVEIANGSFAFYDTLRNYDGVYGVLCFKYTASLPFDHYRYLVTTKTVYEWVC